MKAIPHTAERRIFRLQLQIECRAKEAILQKRAELCRTAGTNSGFFIIGSHSGSPFGYWNTSSNESINQAWLFFKYGDTQVIENHTDLYYN